MTTPDRDLPSVAELVGSDPDFVPAGGVDPRDAIIDKLIVFLGVGPTDCSDGWHWIYASRGVLEPLTDAEVAYFKDWVFPLDRRAGLSHEKGGR